MRIASLKDPAIAATVTARVDVGPFGVDVALDPPMTTLAPGAVGTWTVTITNTGAGPDTFNLMATGVLSGSILFPSPSVALAPGATTSFQVSATPDRWLLAQQWPWTVIATSAGNPAIQDSATAMVQVAPVIGVDLAAWPPEQTISDTLHTYALLAITNTGSLNSGYRLEIGRISGPDGAAASLDRASLAVPIKMAAGVLLKVEVSQPGIYDVPVLARSLDGTVQDSTIARVIVLSAANTPPVAEAGPGVSVPEGGSATLGGSLSDPDPFDAHSAAWSFSDGLRISGTLTPTRSFADDALITATLTVTDTAGARSQDTTTISVTNVAPSAAITVLSRTQAQPDATERVTVELGAARGAAASPEVRFKGSFSDPGALDTHTFAWDFGDGATASGALTASHAYERPGQYVVTFSVTDDDGGVGRDTLLVVVQSGAAPEVTIRPVPAIVEGGVISFTGAISVAQGTEYDLTWSFGDGITATGTLTPSHRYLDDGAYLVTLTLREQDGRSTSNFVLVNVANAAPQVAITAPLTATPAMPVSVSGVFTDPGELDTHTIAWNFGDGATASGTLTPSHAYARPGAYTITITLVVRDDEGGEGRMTWHVTVVGSERKLYIPRIMLNR